MMNQSAPETEEAATKQILPTYLLIADVVQVSVAALLLSYLLFFDTPVGPLVRLILTGSIVWVMVRGWTWVILLAILVNILLREPKDASAYLSLGSAIYAWLCLCLVAYTAGYRTWRRELRYWLGMALQALFHDRVAAATTATESGGDQDSASGLRAGTFELPAYALLKRLLGLLIVVLLAMIVFVQLPVSRSSLELWWERSVKMKLMLWPGPMAFLLAVAGLVLISVVSWRGLSRSEAGLYLRTTVMTYYFRDIRSILGRLKKLRR